MTSVAIVIVSWNTAPLLKTCLGTVMRELKNFDRGKVEVVVVDNASKDGTVTMLAESFPGVRVIANQENVGFASANNQAFNNSDSDYIWMLNPDTELGSGAFSALFEFMESTPLAGAVGSLLHDSEGTLEEAAFPIISPLREIWRLFHLDAIYSYSTYPINRWDHSQPHEVGAVQGASLMLRRQALAQVGVLDPGFFMYTEEVDLCFRLIKAGWKIFWLPSSRVLHHGGQSTRQVRAQSFLNLYRSKTLFIRKHYGWPQSIIYKITLLAAAVPRVIGGLALRLISSRDDDRVLLAKNYFTLIKALPTL